MTGDDEQSRHLARRKHPEPSHKVAAEVVCDGTVTHATAETLAAVRRWPGSTKSELAAAAHLRDPQQFGRRLNELEKAGQIERTAARKCRVTGRTAATWKPRIVEVQRDLFG